MRWFSVLLMTMLMPVLRPADAQRSDGMRVGASRPPTTVMAMSALSSTSPPTSSTRASDASDGRGTRFAKRTALGALAWWPGAIVGAMLGAATAGPCHCDDPGLGQAILGGIVGGALAAGALTALVQQGKCSAAARVFYGTLGSAAGSVIGALVSAGAGGVLVPVVFPLGAGLGAAFALQHC